MKTLFSGWKPFELAWLAISTIVILTLSFIWDDTLLGTVASLSGIICVVLVAKGKISSFYFGIINAATYGAVAYSYQLYGESDLNFFVYLPLQFIGLYLWYKNRKSSDAVNGEDIVAKRLKPKQWAYLILFIALVYFLYAELLQVRGSQLAGLDSLAVVLSIVAQFLMMLRFAEQWLLWIIINVLTIALWTTVLIRTGGQDFTVLAMWIAFLVNSVYGYINWLKISKEPAK